MKINFSNKIVLITGGTNGIGKELVKLFLSLGAQVLTTTTKRNIKSKKKKLRIEYLNFLDQNSVNNFFNKINKLKKIDVLINNAGINKVDNINEIKDQDLKRIYEVNLKGPILMTKNISKIMIKKKTGKIVNISSIFGVISRSGRSMYSSTKFGLLGLTKSSALDLANYNILVNAVSPGFILTNLTKKTLSKNEIKSLTKTIPLKRIGNTKEVTKLIAFLCSNYNTYITGQNFIIDGGFSSQ